MIVLLGLFLGSASYSVYFLGLLNMLKLDFVEASLLVSCCVFGYFVVSRKLYRVHGTLKFEDLLALFLIVAYLLVAMLGTLGPELAFDALWYHLTIPKIFILSQKVFFIPGGLLYYSTFPKLSEMLYIVPLMFHFEVGAKLIHFFFLTLTLFALYKIGRMYVNKTLSLLIVLVFLGNLVVGWEAISAYIDLTRTFYEVLSFYFLLQVLSRQKTKDMLLSGVFLGFAIATKINAIGTLPIYVCMLLIFLKNSWSRKFVAAAAVSCISVVICSPYFLYAFVHTGNPFYPIFSHYVPVSGPGYWSFLGIVNDTVVLFLKSQDPINPFYIIVVPLLFVCYKRFNRKEQMLVLYVFLSLLVWIIFPRTGGSRFFLPYLPVFSVLSIVAAGKLQSEALKRYLYMLIVFLFLIAGFYRLAANVKFFPVVFGIQTKEQFLLSHLHFNYGDFYDQGNAIKNIVGYNKVLLIGFHNLYYVDFPFVDSSWVARSDAFSYVLVQDASLPARFKKFNMIYLNNLTHVKLYKGEKTAW